MIDKLIFIEPLLEKAETYGKVGLELIKLKAADKTADVVSTMISRGAVVLVLSMFTVIANIGIALWLGDLLGKTYYGFFCVAGFYGLVGFILHFFMRNFIKNRSFNSLISQMLN